MLVLFCFFSSAVKLLADHSASVELLVVDADEVSTFFANPIEVVKEGMGLTCKQASQAHSYTNKNWHNGTYPDHATCCHHEVAHVPHLSLQLLDLQARLKQVNLLELLREALHEAIRN